jgi:fibronectin type 3 domain-containing protein
MNRVLAVLILFLSGLVAVGQTTICPAPTPGSPHVCLTWTASTTAGATYNVYRTTTSGAENYKTPLNTTPLAAGTTAYYDATTAVGTTYYYTLAAVGTGGVLSAPTAEVSAQIPVPPNSPTLLTVSID